MASVFALHQAGLCEPGLELRVRGGCDLKVLVPEAAERDGMRRLGLAGPARHVFDGRFPDSALAESCQAADI